MNMCNASTTIIEKLEIISYDVTLSVQSATLFVIIAYDLCTLYLSDIYYFSFKGIVFVK